MALERGGVSWDAYVRSALVATELLLGIALLMYRRVSARNAPDDSDAARDYVARKRRNRRYTGIYVLFLGSIQLFALFAHP